MPPPLVPARARLPLLIALATALGIAVYTTRPTAAPIAEPVSAPPLPITAPPAAPIPPPAPALPPAPPATPVRGRIPGLSVNATFAGRAGGGSILVTRPDGTKALVATGTDAIPGVRLIAVALDRATFETGGATLWLPLQSEATAKADPAPATAIVAAPPPPIAAAPTETERRESILYQTALTPGGEGPYRGYAIRSQTPLFAKAGLKPGDVITGINGRAFDNPAAIATLSREASLSETLVFTIRRDGRSQELRVTP